MSENVLTLGQLFDQLNSEGEVAGEAEMDEHAILQILSAQQAQLDSPWYVKLMVGFSAWLASLLIGMFFGVAGLIDSPESMMLWGAPLLVGAVVLKRVTLPSIFWGQVAFAASLVGQGLLLFGIGIKTEDVTLTLFCVVALELLLFLLFPDLVHRLLSALAICAALVALLYQWEMLDAIHLLTLGLAVASLAVWLNNERFLTGRLASFHAPLGYGLVLSLFAVMFLKVADLFGVMDPSLWWLSTLGLAAMLLYLGLWTLHQLDIPLASLSAFAVIGAVVLIAIPAYDTPGILAALLVLLLGFWSNSRLLLGLAILFLLLFLGIYYYYLDVTLLNKSYILMGSGGVLLLFWAIFRQLSEREEEVVRGT